MCFPVVHQSVRAAPPYLSRSHLGVKCGARAYFSSKVPSKVRIIEVGPRDGLQNIAANVPTVTKVELINRLAAAGLTNIEATSFVSAKWVPQLADGKDVMDRILPLTKQRDQLRFSVLAPNFRGFENAVASGAKEIVVFASATEAFSQKNQNCTVQQALQQARTLVEHAKEHKIRVRGVVSCIFSDPYSGPTDPKDVHAVVKEFIAMGCDEVGLGDTMGVGTPKLTQTLLELLLRDVPANLLTGHFHDTYGQAVANVVRAYDMGLRTFDSSVAGLGGCPYAPGAKGNVATEDIVYTFEQSGIETNINLLELASVGAWISQQLGIANRSRAGAALMAKQQQTKTQNFIASNPASAPASIPNRAPEKDTHQALNPERATTRRWTVLSKTEGFTITKSLSSVKVTMARSNNGNAMTIAMVESLTRIFRDLAADSSVFQIVLASEGKFFCTGMDLKGDSRDDSSRYHDKIVALFKAIDGAPQTTIAAIHGPCYGGGVGLGFACDVRLASAAARWTLSEIKLGVSPAIISKYMAREWGLPFFREAMLSAREVTPQELSAIGAVHGIGQTQQELDSLVDTYMDRLANCAPRAAATCKELARVASAGLGSSQQDTLIRRTFDNMLAPGSEGEHGIQQFARGNRKVDWKRFWESRNQAGI